MTNKIYAGGCFCMLLFIIIWVSISIKTVEALHRGIRVDTFYKNIESDTFTKGIYFTWPWNDFAQYPTDFVSIDRVDHCWAQDGQVIKIDYTVYFKIKPDQMVLLYRTFPNYMTNLKLKIITATKNACTQLNSYDFYKNRNYVQTLMEQQYEKVVQKFAQGALSFEIYQLRSINVNSQIENAINQKMVVFETVKMTRNQNEINNIGANIQKTVDVGNARISQVSAFARREANKSVSIKEQELEYLREKNYLELINSYVTGFGLTYGSQSIKLYLLLKLYDNQGITGQNWIAGVSDTGTIWIS